MKGPRIAWGTRLGFYFAAVGSAFGLGNLWRFPYVVAENGGGAFVLVYVLMAFGIGFPLIVGELILGKTTQKSAIVAMDRSGRWRAVGVFATLVTVLVLSYYAVISGWVIYYAAHTVMTLLSSESQDPGAPLAFLHQHGGLQVGLAMVHLALLGVVVLKDVEQGIEKWVGYIMPLFLSLLLVLMAQTLSLPESGEALRFLFYPDFSKLSWSAPVQALGHVLFTLSVGFGTMVTFGSYLRENENVPTAAYRVTALDTLISLLGGLVVFPVILSFGETLRGPDVLFQALPSLFIRLESGAVFGLVFYVCLYLAALTASLGLFESVVANVRDIAGLKRPAATLLTVTVIAVVAVFPAVGSELLVGGWWHGRTALQWLDGLIIHLLLPVSALGVSLFVRRHVSDQIKRSQFEVSPAVAPLYRQWCFVTDWAVPAVVVSCLLLQLVSLLRR